MLFASVVAIGFNWRNSRVGYWLNLVLVSATDLGFVIFVLAPGYLTLFPGVVGPMLWVLAVVLSTLGLRRAPEDDGTSRGASLQDVASASTP